MDNSLVWFIVGIVFLFAELVMPGFVIFFFGIGALVTALLAFFFNINSVIIQLLIFIGTSILSLVILRRSFSQLFKGKISNEKEVSDEFIGKRAKVISEIKPNSLNGKVEFNGTNWEADSDFYIDKGTVVVIVGRRNITLIVKPVE